MNATSLPRSRSANSLVQNSVDAKEGTLTRSLSSNSFFQTSSPSNAEQTITPLPFVRVHRDHSHRENDSSLFTLFKLFCLNVWKLSKVVFFGAFIGTIVGAVYACIRNQNFGENLINGALFGASITFGIALYSLCKICYIYICRPLVNTVRRHCCLSARRRRY